MYKKIIAVSFILVSVLMISNIATARCWQRFNGRSFVRRCVSRPHFKHCGRHCRRRWNRTHSYQRNSISITW